MHVAGHDADGKLAILAKEAADWTTLIAAHDAFWADAGVDMAFADSPRDLLAEAASARAPAEVPRPAPIAPPPPRPLGPAAPAPVAAPSTGLPLTLAEFAPWWLSEPSLDPGPRERRVPPRGQAGAPLMVLVAEPEASDEAMLLAGPDGALFDAIEQAMGFAPGTVYRAAALPRHTPAADWNAVAQTGLGAILRHHVALAAPERLLVLSRNVLDLLAPDGMAADGTGTITVNGASIPLLAAYPLAQMAARTGTKRIFWHRWLAFAAGH